ncbi:hypothetical protein BE17_36220 [Sorangium cellulosum]|uniref:Uncharacterized protein n=1 Tax=Sorangium cellulosum TaxID=56 RepID=A0A150SJG1_SORCE|nr:hypothetical protein BE17_36220 [Sorangium cellulosum]
MAAHELEGAGHVPRQRRGVGRGGFAHEDCSRTRRRLTVSCGRGARLWTAAFSPDGKRIVTASQDKTIRVWNADGTGEPLILRGSDSPVNSAEFSPDGKRIITASDDMIMRVWTDLAPLGGVDDPKLWTATTYCMPVERRMELLRVPEAMAHADRQACLRHVEEARAAVSEQEGGGQR